MILISQPAPNTAQPIQSDLRLLRFCSDRTMLARPQGRLELVEVSQFRSVWPSSSQHLVCNIRLVAGRNIVLTFCDENRHW